MIKLNWMRVFQRTLFAVVLAGLGGGIFALVQNSTFVSDLSFFQPETSDRKMQLAVSQMNSGPSSNFVFVALTGGTPEDLAETSALVVESLRQSDHFEFAINGSIPLESDELDFLLDRYLLLGPDIKASAFETKNIRAGLENALEELKSISDQPLARLFFRDPIGHIAATVDTLLVGEGPTTYDGVWFSDDLSAALLVGNISSDAISGSQQVAALDYMEAEFEQLRASDDMAIQMSGASVFARTASSSIQSEAMLISVISSLILVAVIRLAFRSWEVVLCFGVPLVGGVVAGAGVVQWLFGSIHGIAFTFGATLTAISVDYPIHVASHLDGNKSRWRALNEIRSPLTLGAASTAIALAPMSVSSFPGLAQLGVFAVVGIATAAIITQTILPTILVPKQSTPELPRALGRGTVLALPTQIGLFALAIFSVAYLTLNEKSVFTDDLSRLSPVSPELVAVDRRLRGELGASDVRRMIIVEADTQERVLRKQERLAPRLDQLVKSGDLGGFRMTAQMLPSIQKQRSRATALPSPEIVRANILAALSDTGVRPQAFDRFLAAIADAKSGRYVRVADFNSIPILHAQLRATLFEEEPGSWVGLVLLNDVENAAAIEEEVERIQTRGLHYIDLKRESENLMANYRAESLGWLGVGVILAAIGIFAALNPARAFRMAFAITIAMALTVSVLVLAGELLSPFHIISLILVLGLSLDYALFLSRETRDDEGRSRTLFAVLVCASTSVAVFFVMSFSSTPVLSGIGFTVAVGTAISLIAMTAFFAKDEKDRIT